MESISDIYPVYHVLYNGDSWMLHFIFLSIKPHLSLLVWN